MLYVKFVIIGVIAYLIGCVNPAIILGNVTNIDIRSEGSGNPGTTNVLRVMGWKGAFLTFIVDMFKGLISTIIGLLMAGNYGGMVAFGMVLIGHIFPVFYKFKGGKGMAVAFGAALALNFPSAIMVFLVSSIVTLSSKKMSIGSIAACVTYPLFMWIYYPYNKYLIIFAGGVGLFLILLHISNIQKLLKREEPDIEVNIREHILSTEYMRIKAARTETEKSTDSPVANEAAGMEHTLVDEPEPQDYYEGVVIPKLKAKDKCKIGVIGNGSFGTAMANLLVHNGHDVTLYGRKQEAIDQMKETNMNEKYLPYVILSDKIKYTAHLKEAVVGMDIVVNAVPTQQFRSIAKKLVKIIEKEAILVNLAKGIEQGSTMRLSEIADEILPDTTYVALSGPTHAEEIVRNFPSSIVSASKNQEAAKKIQDVFMNDKLRVYTQDDLLGVEIAGALKNVIAIATGVCDGMKYGSNARAALMTRSIHEIERMGKALGAKESTFSGLAGIGDLMVTCTTNLSRNRRCGLFIGLGLDADEAVEKVGSTVEGFFTAAAICKLAKKEKIEMPICEVTNKVLRGKLSPEKALDILMTRPKKGEKE